MDKKELSCRLPRIRKRAHRCYELAFRGWLQSSEQGDSWELVHGWWGLIGCGHAWLEKGEIVYCPVLDAVFTKDEYRSSRRAIEFRRFAGNEPAQLAAASHYGPWNPELEKTSFEYFEQVPDCGFITTAPPTISRQFVATLSNPATKSATPATLINRGLQKGCSDCSEISGLAYS